MKAVEREFDFRTSAPVTPAPFLSVSPEHAISMPTVSPSCWSTGIVAGAVMVKVPQIQRILAKRSVEGLRFQMFASEVVSGTVAIAYFMGQGIALAAYAELFFILAQNLIIIALMGVYGGKGKKGGAVKELMPAAIVYGVMATALISGRGGTRLHAQPHPAFLTSS